MKKLGRRSVDEHRETGGGVAGIDPLNNLSRETNLDQDELEIIPIHTIICLLEIEFKNERIQILGLDGMQEFLSHSHGISNFPIL